ncbi:Krueppel-like factor luna [Drosophila serrata]|uniref:Krueppel-like factor luna n=1 Tax=Drosophila serrata TaxID=7274 RepID=UPI000A1D00BF|nr:Krueppel-like factor luna [Drosophila serrata]
MTLHTEELEDVREQGLKDPNLDRHTSKAKSRHFTVNGLSANNTLQQQQQQQQFNLQPSNDSRNIYNNPYIPPQQQQQQPLQQTQTQQQRTAHLFKALAASAAGSNSLTHPYDFSTSSSSSNANNDHQGSSSSEAENAFLTHNNGKWDIKTLQFVYLLTSF